MIARPTLLPDPEQEWERSDALSVTRAEVEQRIGALDGALELFIGGRANTNVAIGADRVLRIYRRDPKALDIEHALLTRSWQSLRVPRVLAAGSDFLLLERVAHGPLEASREHGTAVGRALAEIHRQRFEFAGFFGSKLGVSQPLPDFVAALEGHLRELFLGASAAHRDLEEAVFQHLADKRSALIEAASQPVLLHGDFKPSNLHWAAEGRPLVLDWEFAFAGPALMDIGQLLRWSPPLAFLDAFASAYQDAGAQLPSGWRALASAFDLANLVGLLANAAPGSRRARDARDRISLTFLD